MPICKRRKLAFIHIPKTAGTVITKLLDLEHEENLFLKQYGVYEFDGVKYSPQHLTPDLLQIVVPESRDFFKFCLTRHPYEKVVSEYFWLKKDFEKRPVRFYSERGLQKWITSSLALKDLDHKLDQYKFVQGCDEVYRQEDFLADPQPVLKSLGIQWQQKLPKGLHNKKNTKRIATGLSQKTKHLIQEIFPEDFEMLGYTR